MQVELITIGDELLYGKTLDTNAAYMSENLGAIGVTVVRVTTVGDTVEHIEEALHSAVTRADAVIVTGGLGPTPDDLTRQAVAQAFGRGLVFREDVYRDIEMRWKRRGKPVPESARILAHVPEGTEVMKNAVGAAAGLKLTHERTIFFFLPGVPDEMRSMMDDCVLPFLATKAAGRAIRHRLLKTAGITESALHEKLQGIEGGIQAVKIAYLPQHYEVHVRLTADGTSVKVAENSLARTEKVVREHLGYYIYGTADESLEGVVAGLLLDGGMSLCVAESCTGGLITGRLTDIPGSSKFLERGVIVYSGKSKNEMLSVSKETLETYGTVSPETTKCMAENVMMLGRTDLGLAVTGIMGPSGETPEKPAGLVYISLAHADGTYDKEFRFAGDRVTNKNLAAQAALNELRLFLLKNFKQISNRRTP
ncbi:MAG: competence/damage-inducible protein A [Gemmatimonadota bacterium]|nr:MAG: competence/damage-inducible protein A [Gemmatimonadota bacterium]